MLTETQRGFLETKLQNMEAGRFQEFMLKFLPALDVRYEGIVRYGGTEFGKTKAGVPDSIKTLANGDEIACECGTELDYWTPPKDPADFGEKWKPAADALKCLKRLTRPVEIVVASTRAIPQGHPSAKTQLIDFLKQRSPAAVLPISSENIAVWFENNAFSPKGQELLRQFFPEVFESFGASARNDVLEATLRHSDQMGLPVALIQKIVEGNPNLSEGEISGLVQEQLGYDSSPFLLAANTPFRGITRVDSAPSALRRPLGRCLQLLGVPKIGKSWLCQESLEAERLSSASYLTPTHESRLPEFLDAILVDIFSELWPRREVVAARRKNQLLQLPVEAARAPSQPKVFVIENAHLLRKSELLELAEAVRFLRPAGLYKSIGLVLVTNKTIATQMSAVDETCVAPAWTRDQLLLLLEQQKIKPSGLDAEKYGDLLSSMSGGHPLIAASLARRYPSGAALVTAMATQPKPDPQDIDLSNELKNVLYQEILTSPDKQNLVQRLSLLIGRADGKVLEWLRLKVQPPIQTPLDVLFDEIGGAVLDGDPKTGLAVSPTFKKVAFQRMTPEESRVVYRTMANELFRPVKRTFDAAALIDSAWYSVMAGDFGKAFSCASFLLFGVSKKQPDATIIKALMSRLEFLQWIRVPADDPVARLSYYSYLTTAAHYSESAKDPASRAGMLEKIDLEWLRTNVFADKDLTEMAGHLRIAVLGQRVLGLHADKDPVGVLTAYLDEVSVPNPTDPLSKLLDVLPLLISKLPAARLKEIDLIRVVDLLARKSTSALADLALLIGNAAHQQPELSPLIDRPTEANARRELFFKLARAYRTFNSGKHAAAAEALEAVEKEAATLRITNAQLGAAFLQFKGDVYFELGNGPASIEAYQKSNALAGKWDQAVPSWNYFRMGLISPDIDAGLAWLEKAAVLFSQQGNDKWHGRALGAAATTLLREKRYLEGLQAAERLALLYHKDQKAVGAGLRLLLSQILRLKSELSGESLPEPLTSFPKLETRSYLHLPDALTVESSGAATFNVLAGFAAAIGRRDQALALLRQAFEFDGDLRGDRGAWLMNMLTFLTLIEPSDIDWSELRHLFSTIPKNRPEPGDKVDTFYFESVLRPLRQKAVKEPAKWGDIAMQFFSELSNTLRGQLDPNRGQWDIRLNLARGEVQAAMGSPKEAANHYQEAFDAAAKDGHWSLAIEAGGQLSFVLFATSGSLRELAERQHATLQAIAQTSHNEEQLRNFGINMFRCWSTVKWARLVASDLRTKDLILDGAVALREASVGEGDAAPVMLALLSRVFNDGGVPQLSFARERLPDQVQKLLA